MQAYNKNYNQQLQITPEELYNINSVSLQNNLAKAGLNTNAVNNGKKYFDIDSTFRNRRLYPNACDFVMDINAPIRDTPTTALDPILLAFPYETNLTSGGSTLIQIALSVSSSNIRNFYQGSYLEINNEFRLIISYDAFTQVATVASAFSAAPPALTPYTIRKKLPFQYNVTTQAQVLVPIPVPDPDNKAQFNLTPANQKIRLSATSSTKDEYYVNYFVFVPDNNPILNPPLSYQYARITRYDGATRMAILDRPFDPAATAAGINYEILEFNRDNVVPLKYSGNQTINNPILLKINLVYVTIPNRYIKGAYIIQDDGSIIQGGYGGLLSDYNYIYVALYSGSSKTSNYSLYSNNPYSSLALFKVPITFLRNVVTQQTFLTLNFTGMTQTISFRERDTLHFTVFLQNGNVLAFEPFNKDSYFNDFIGRFPIESDPLEQVTACFEIDPKI